MKVSILQGYARSPHRSPGKTVHAVRMARRSLAALVTAIVWIVSCGPAFAHAMSACTNPIVACPCAIKFAGDYAISGPGLIATPPGHCIHVNVPGVILDFGRALRSPRPRQVQRASACW